MSSISRPSKADKDNNMQNFSLCICTYKRPQLLARLLGDIYQQTRQPERIIVVDGDPDSDAVNRLLNDITIPKNCQVIYLPSNHANLSYQRYLGWRVARELEAPTLLYLDDDLRIYQKDALAKILAPFAWPDKQVAGVTAHIHMGDPAQLFQSEVLQDRCLSKSIKKPLLVRWLGSARGLKPGELSPSGHRKAPEYYGQDYEEVFWLRGGVMAFSLTALTADCFSEDLFALDEIRCGLGEDTFLSRKVICRGKLLLANCAVVEHPNADLPKSYPYQAYKFGYASAYSRRLLNDHYRGFEPPRLADRIALVKSYLGTALLNWYRAVTGPRKYRFAYAWGYTLGACRGLIQKPTARNLTPHINWWQDAEAALQQVKVIRHGTCD